MRKMLRVVLALSVAPAAATGHDSPEHAVERLTAALESQAPSAQLLAARADELRALGRLAEAIADYEAALVVEPDNVHAALGLARSLIATGQHERAAEFAGVAAARATDKSSAALLAAARAEALECGDHHHDALAAWRAAVASPSPQVDWLLSHADAEGRVHGPLARYEALAAARHRNPSVVLVRAMLEAAVDANKPDEALPEIEANLAAARWKSIWRCLRAKALHASGDPPAAEDELRQALAEVEDRLVAHPRNPALERQRDEVVQLLKRLRSTVAVPVAR
jgi:tetratricopeptide (TPR) repeat protein